MTEQTTQDFMAKLKARQEAEIPYRCAAHDTVAGHYWIDPTADEIAASGKSHLPSTRTEIEFTATTHSIYAISEDNPTGEVVYLGTLDELVEEMMPGQTAKATYTHPRVGLVRVQLEAVDHTAEVVLPGRRLPQEFHQTRLVVTHVEFGEA